MKLKSKSGKGGCLRALALVPVAALAVVTVNLPFMADAKTSVGPVSMQLVGSSANADTQVSSGPTSDVPEPALQTKDDDQQFEDIIQEPSFPGGDQALSQWISSNLRYPADAPEGFGTARVVVWFMVSADGTIKNPKIVRSVSRPFNAEAIRVVSAMPKWIPGKCNGESVDASYALSIVFKEQ